MNELTLSKRTVDILANFGNINQSILLRKGKVLRSMHNEYQMFTKAEIVEDIPEEFAIYDLSTFLSTLSSFEKPTLKLDSKTKRMIISQGQRKTFLKYADLDHIITPSEGDIKLKDVFCTFDITKEGLTNAQKFLGILSLPEFAISVKKGKLSIECINSENIQQNENTENFYSDTLGKVEGEDFRVVLRGEYINYLLKSEDYKVQIGKFTKDGDVAALVNFKGPDVSYFVASEASSVL